MSEMRQIDRTLLTLGDLPFSMRFLLNGGWLDLGRPGSGKSFFSGRALALSILRYLRSGMLVLSSAPTDLEMWQELCAMAGRSEDFIVFGPRHKHTFNLVNGLVGLGMDSKDIAKAIKTIGGSMDGDDEQAGGGNTDKFWPIKTRQGLETACEVIRMGDDVFSIPKLHEFIVTAPPNVLAVADPRSMSAEEWGKHPASAWRQGYHFQCFERAFKKASTPQEKADFENAQKFWLTEWPGMGSDSKTRSSIEAGMTGLLHVFNSGLVRTLISADTTLPLKVLDDGKIIFVDMSVGQYGSSGAVVMNSLRYYAQQYVLRRHPGRWVNPIILWMDEAGKLVNPADSFYLTESRKFGGASVFLAQSMRSFQAAMPGDKGKALAEVLMGCFATKCLHAIGDPGTAEWAAKLLGQEIKTTYGWSPDHHQKPWELLRGHGRININGSERLAWCVEPKEFMHDMRTGEGGVSDAYIILSGNIFPDGKAYRKVDFHAF